MAHITKEYYYESHFNTRKEIEQALSIAGIDLKEITIVAQVVSHKPKKTKIWYNTVFNFELNNEQKKILKIRNI